MSAKNVVPVVVLKPKEERRITRGHLWVYRNELVRPPDTADGTVVDVFAADRRFVGRGFYQQEGGIAVRILLRRQSDVDGALLRGRIHEAHQLRRQLFPASTVYRWVHGESDALPGLVVDRYGALVVAHTECAFYDNSTDVLLESLLACDGVETALLHSATGCRREGAEITAAAFDIDGVSASISPDATQKTGLFLDQRCNWPMTRTYAQGASVLDCHCYHGFWGIHAALGGAASVLGVDTSAAALEAARANCAANGVNQCSFEQNEAETVLASGRTFDVVILDPPAYAKHRTQRTKAAGRYERINSLAMNALNAPGILITSSCSHFVSGEDFLEMLKRAARRCGRQAQLLAFRGAGPDHPVLMSMPETGYLKCAVLRVV